jgi:putative flippase GtrA
MGIVVQFAALFTLKSVLHLNYLTATAIAVEAAVIHNFAWHEKFTWADRIDACDARNGMKSGCRRSLHRLLRFHLSNGFVSILGNLALMKAIVGEAHINYLLANAIAIALCSLLNFVLSETWVFGRN